MKNAHVEPRKELNVPLAATFAKPGMYSLLHICNLRSSMRFMCDRCAETVLYMFLVCVIFAVVVEEFYESIFEMIMIS